ncbi:MAG: glutathione S-transferase N-terminal domain-containing protein [Deltaproteobacteria bacterium]|nr:glutathione S-transferase N-terminal domain-containing protein [Deltaproteobacteria bacterium]MBI2540880.1 glutathione S-transferase N-terminal domain-containing protein [Deltaproteobacteria bacterium]
MIDLYTWTTPNGRKVSVMLEEVGLPYKVHPVNLQKDEQFNPEFLAINPNNKIPAIIDPQGPGGKPLTLFESGAILIYLAEKTGKLMPKESRSRYEVIQWLMFQMGGVGPMFGQAHNFFRYDPQQNSYGVERFNKEVARLYRVMNHRLGETEFLAGGYSIADIATYPWVSRYEMHRTRLEDFPNVKRWFDAISARPAVQRGMNVPKG